MAKSASRTARTIQILMRIRAALRRVAREYLFDGQTYFDDLVAQAPGPPV